MKILNRKFLAAGLLASALTFVGCKSDSSAERKDDTMQTPPADTTEGTTTTPAEGTDTQTSPGTGGSGTENISKTKQTDDNIRYPREDPLRTPEPESIRDAESEDERGVHDSELGTGGSGFEDEATDDSLNEGGNVDDTTPPQDNMINETQIPEGTR